MKVHQLNSSLTFGDAITNHTFEIDKILRKWGFDTNIFSEIIGDRNIRQKAQIDTNYEKYIDYKDDLLIFHYSVYCKNVCLYKKSKNIKIFDYHNITFPEYFRGYDDNLYGICKMGRDELKRLTRCNIGLGDSEYNRMELVLNGFNESTSDVLPIFLHYEDFDSTDINTKLFDKFDDGYVNILFVGRIVPNKKIEDIIKVFYIYNKNINSKSRLFIVGTRFLKIYDRQLNDLIFRLKAKNIIFSDKVSLADLKTYYRLAHIFLCMSEHEGFCVPLIESMYFKIPIISYKSTAIPYTLKDAGILANEKSYVEIAELIDTVVNDNKLHNQIIKKQNERLAYFDRRNVEDKLKIIIERALS